MRRLLIARVVQIVLADADHFSRRDGGVRGLLRGFSSTDAQLWPVADSFSPTDARLWQVDELNSSPDSGLWNEDSVQARLLQAAYIGTTVGVAGLMACACGCGCCFLMSWHHSCMYYFCKCWRGMCPKIVVACSEMCCSLCIAWEMAGSGMHGVHISERSQMTEKQRRAESPNSARRRKMGLEENPYAQEVDVEFVEEEEQKPRKMSLSHNPYATLSVEVPEVEVKDAPAQEVMVVPEDQPQHTNGAPVATAEEGSQKLPAPVAANEVEEVLPADSVPADEPSPDSPPSPHRWSPAKCSSTGRTYFYHQDTGETQWHAPEAHRDHQALPAGWAEHIAANGRSYFHHALSGLTQWSKPKHSTAPVSAH